MPVPIFALTSEHNGNRLSESFKRSATGLLVIEDKSRPLACRLMLQLPQVYSGGRERDYFGGDCARPIQREKGPIARTPDVMLDIGIEEVGERQGWATHSETKVEVIGTGARIYPDVNSALQEIVILTIAQKSDCEFVSIARDNESHIKNISLTRVLYDLDVG